MHNITFTHAQHYIHTCTHYIHTCTTFHSHMHNITFTHAQHYIHTCTTLNSASCTEFKWRVWIRGSRVLLPGTGRRPPHCLVHSQASHIHAEGSFSRVHRGQGHRNVSRKALEQNSNNSARLTTSGHVGHVVHVGHVWNKVPMVTHGATALQGTSFPKKLF